MNFRVQLVLTVMALGAAAFSLPSNPATHESLDPVHSRFLDEVHFRPTADLNNYRRIVIDPVQVSFHKRWLENMARSRSRIHGISENEVRRIAEETASSLQSVVADAFRARGYEIVEGVGPSVLRVSPRVVDLYVNAPDRFSPFTTKVFIRDAGEAMLVMEVRDAIGGDLLVRILHRGTAHGTGRLTRASNVSNRYWFDSLFVRWAEDCVAELEAGKTRAGSATAPAGAP